MSAVNFHLDTNEKVVHFDDRILLLLYTELKIAITKYFQTLTGKQKTPSVIVE